MTTENIKRSRTCVYNVNFTSFGRLSISDRKLFLKFPQLKERLWGGPLWNSSCFIEPSSRRGEVTSPDDLRSSPIHWREVHWIMEMKAYATIMSFESLEYRMRMLVCPDVVNRSSRRSLGRRLYDAIGQQPPRRCIPHISNGALHQAYNTDFSDNE
ncbi:hypothetical protein E1757_01475 [Paenibacillus piri]|uniref:Uncharacterized protein n=1 Tax=Paenibacillus piri TaxID=2547395 RepID=A0A4R5KZ32_9BACL|nr:hypothetical protein E1757_01475 [Paenibacillus piri]